MQDRWHGAVNVANKQFLLENIAGVFQTDGSGNRLDGSLIPVPGPPVRIITGQVHGHLHTDGIGFAGPIAAEKQSLTRREASLVES